MGKRICAAHFVTAAVILTACSPLEEAPASGTIVNTQIPTSQSTLDIKTLKSSQIVDGRFYELNGPFHFSYVPPEGWTLQPSVQSGLASWIGPELTAGGKMLFIIYIIQSDKSGKDALQYLLDQFPPDQYQIDTLEAGAFTTQMGGDAYRARLRVTNQIESRILGIYFFSKDGQLIYPAYSRLADEHSEQDAIVDTSMQTFRFEE
jgi:hypothetical protein